MSTSPHATWRRAADLPPALVGAILLHTAPFLVLGLWSMVAGAAGRTMQELAHVAGATVAVSAAGWLLGRQVLDRYPGGRDVRFAAGGRANTIVLSCGGLILLAVVLLRDSPAGLVLAGTLLIIANAVLAGAMVDPLRRLAHDNA